MTERSPFNTINAANPSTAVQLSNGLFDDVLDLQGLHDRCMGNLDLVQRVLDKFEKRLPDELAELECSLELEDSEKVAQVAHRIKGNSSNVSAAGLRQAAAEIEAMGRAGQLSEVPLLLDDLQEQWRRYVVCRNAIWPSSGGAAASAVNAAQRNAESAGASP
jgi:HPt (histidine-containing phosphotransfer) domain-containing protein